MVLLFLDLIIGTCLLLIAVIDAKTFIIPDRLSFFVIGAALLRIMFSGGEDIVDPLLGGLVALLVFEATRRIMAHRLKRDALGMGDVKLMIGGGLWIGLSSLPAAILLACLGGIGHFAILALFYRSPIRERKIPFGPYLVFGLLIMKLHLIPDTMSLLMPL